VHDPLNSHVEHVRLFFLCCDIFHSHTALPTSLALQRNQSVSHPFGTGLVHVLYKLHFREQYFALLWYSPIRFGCLWCGSC
jgi:hypothetical protein